MKIKVASGGSDGIWIADKESVVEFLREYAFDEIHNYMPASRVLSADWNKDSVIKEVEDAERIAVLTGWALRNNMMHALLTIRNKKLLAFDIGELTEYDLLISEVEN